MCDCWPGVVAWRCGAQSAKGYNERKAAKEGRMTEAQLTVSPRSQSADAEMWHRCIVCMENDRNVALMPCRHMYTCKECTQVRALDRLPLPLR